MQGWRIDALLVFGLALMPVPGRKAANPAHDINHHGRAHCLIVENSLVVLCLFSKLLCKGLYQFRVGQFLLLVPPKGNGLDSFRPHHGSESSAAAVPGRSLLDVGHGNRGAAAAHLPRRADADARRLVAGPGELFGHGVVVAQSDEIVGRLHLQSVGGNDQAMATSGDYRNFFEVEGTRYSHTIDPRTANPISHQLASVSVVADSCMAADAWATALNVLGPKEGLEAATRETLNSLLISRKETGFILEATGNLASYASNASSKSTALDDVALVSGTGNSVAVIGITVVAFGLILSAMAVGVMFGRRAISGSCGGLGNQTGEDGSVSCSLCSNPSDACKELRERMEKETSV